MRTRMAWLAALTVLAGGGLFVFSQTPGPDRVPLPAPPGPGAAARPQPAPARPAGRDLSRLTLVQRQLAVSAQRGADWLQRSTRPDGRFGYVAAPALRLRSDNDHYLRQAGAACALARAARFNQDERAAASATQAVLTLLLATAPDPKDPQVRCTTVPSTAVNRLAAAGLLVLAVHELPAPATDLLAQADQLCNYLRSRQKADGSLSAADGPEAGAGETPEAADAFAAEALYALARSHLRRPAPWKPEVLRKALAYYHPRWQARKGLAALPRLTGAWAEAYLATGERAFADAALELCDWLGPLQYQQLDAQRPQWVGGFMGWADGRAVPRAPEADSARYLEALAEGCRVARKLGDAQRHPRYREALERGLQFLVTLQYNAASTQHFAEWYRREIAGAFHTSHEDGNLRLDYTQHAVCALLHYLTHVAEVP
jgi:hypothetical protein